MAFSSSSSLLQNSSIPPPAAFYCPISLELMTDPVTLSSGITYDRASIQSWLSSGHLTCPVTRQPLLPHPLFVPNHTLLRIIRTWCDAHSPHDNKSIALLNLHSSAFLQDGCIRLGYLCRDALSTKLGLSIPSTELVPQEEAAPLLISLISHYGADACREDESAQRICAEALSSVAFLPASSHNLSSLSCPNMLQYLSHALYSGEIYHRVCAVCLLAKLLSQHPSPKCFLRSFSPQFLGNLASGLAQFFKQSNPSNTYHTQEILQSLCVIFKASQAIFSSFAEAELVALVHAVMEQVLHALRQGSTPVSENALALLEVLSSYAEGRAAIASHGFVVPTMAKFLQKSSGEVAMAAAVVVLWKLCRYSSEEKVKRQAMTACVPSKLVLLMQMGHCSGRARRKAARLVRLLIGEACKSKPSMRYSSAA